WASTRARNFADPRSCRKRCADLLRHHVRGVPVGPIRVGLTGELLVLTVGDGCAPHRICEIFRGEELRLGCAHVYLPGLCNFYLTVSSHVEDDVGNRSGAA